MRGGAYAEMFWTGTEDRGGYGMMDKNGAPWPVFHAKKLCAQYVRYGDWISFPNDEQGNPAVDVVVARGRMAGGAPSSSTRKAKRRPIGCRSWLATCPTTAGCSRSTVELEIRCSRVNVMEI